ncbi:MAG: phenylalanine--tRNA ligase subunit beta [Ruminococcaceae bacterium]|nr:phenylalanine--tRNA ligase subunit beta [Oscillospiraceae bacterium]
MNLSMKWLADYVDVKDVDIRDYCEKLTYTGSKVEGYEVLGDDISNVVVARIVKMERHPDSDHLFICQMDCGAAADGIQQIVTGAQNVFEGAIVPAALPVAHLPGDVVIKAGKLRGVPSNGMLCSFGELNLTEHDCPGKEANGILILGEEYADKIGMDIREALDLNDTVVEFEITSNRPDCLSMIGLARETAVSFGRPLNLHTPEVKGVADGDKIENYLTVGIEAPDLCYRYSARVVKNVKIGPSPLWMRRRLRAAGVRPINNIVDITNYVMLEYGQPMHAFDYAMLDGAAIRVRRAADGECFKSLDDQDHVLDSSMLVIADGQKACALAGVMGGANSEIKDGTATVVFESACFLGSSVRVTAKKNKMRTESSARFEKELDPENTMPALQRACELVEILGAGDVVDGIIDCYPTHKPEVRIPLEVERMNKFLGVDLSREYMISVLEQLECRIDGDPAEAVIIPPSFRGDLLSMNDIAEEIIRIYGYNEIKATYMNAETTQGGRNPKQAFEVALDRALYGMGLDQIQTFSFISPKFYDRIRMPADSALRKSVVISNPLGEDTSVMRTTALPSMLEVLERNNNFSNESVRLFEDATVYIPADKEGDLPAEKKVLTLGMYGGVDFYAVKGVIENILTLARIKDATFTACDADPAYHPGRCAKVLAADGAELAIFGQIHPVVAADYGFNQPVYCGCVDFEALWAHANTVIDYKPLPKFPATTRDFSFICPEEMEVGSIMAVMVKAGGKLVENVALFDIYRGESIGAGNKSVAFRVTLRAPDKTLTVEEADKASKKILKDLEFKLGLKLRG